MGCVSSKNTKDAGDQEPPYQRSTTANDKSAAVSRPRSERPDVGYDVGQDSVKLSRDSGDAEDRHKSNERRRTAEPRTASDASRQPPSSAAAKVSPVRTIFTSAESTQHSSPNNLRRSTALSSSGSGVEKAPAVQPAVSGGRSAGPRDAGERRRTRTSKSSDVDSEKIQSTSRRDDVVAPVPDVVPDVPSPKISDQPLTNHQRPGRSEERALNGHVTTVAKDATTELPGAPRTSVDDRRKFDADDLPLKSRDRKAATTSATTSGRDSARALNGHEEQPVVVAKDATVVVTDGSRSPVETGTGGELKDDEQPSPMPLAIEHQTDIKPVNPEMVIFDVLRRQEASKRRSGTDDSDAQTPTSPARHEPNRSSPSHSEAPNAIEANKMAAVEAEVTSPRTSTTQGSSAVAAASERSSIPRSMALISQTSVEAGDQGHSKPADVNGELCRITLVIIRGNESSIY